MSPGSGKVGYRAGPALIGSGREDASAFAKAGARAFFIGVVLVTLQVWITPYVEEFMDGTHLAFDHLPKGPIIGLFVLILFVNVLLMLNRFAELTKALFLIAVNVLFLFSYLIFFMRNGLPSGEGAAQWWAAHILVYTAVNSLLVCLAWKSPATRAAGGVFFNISALVLIVLRFVPHAAAMDLYDVVSLVFELSMLAGLNLLIWSKPLDRAEMLVVYCMLLIGAMLPNMGLYGYLIPVTSGHLYYETPESGWKAAFYDHVPPWVCPKDPVGVGAGEHPRPIRWLYEGVPKGERIPWSAWLAPLFYWSVFAIFLYLTMFCISVILRKQWIDRERLPFPLAQVPLAMTEGAGSGQLLTPFFKSRLMWMGFLIPFLAHSFISMGDIWPSIPVDGVRTHLRYGGWGVKTFDADFLTDPPWSWLKPMWIMIYPSVIGLTYLLSLEVSFSLWFFYFIGKIQSIIAVSMGYGDNQWAHMGKEGFASFWPSQGVGAMAAMVIVGFYMARGHISDVVKRALGLVGVDDVDDRNEPMSYRFTFFGLIIGVLGSIIFLIWAGMSVLFATMSILLFMIIVIGLSRIVAEGGLNYVQSWAAPLNLMTGAVGTKPLGSANLTMGAFVHGIFQFDLRCVLMPAMIHSFKIAGEGRVKRRYIGMAVVAAVLLSLVLGPIAFLKISYDVGGSRLNHWFYIMYPPSPFNSATRDIKENRREALGGALASAEAAETAVRLARSEDPDERKPDGGVDVAAVEAAAKAAREAVGEYRAMLDLRSDVAACDTALIQYMSGTIGDVGVQESFADLKKGADESLKDLLGKDARDLDADDIAEKIDRLVKAVASFKDHSAVEAARTDAEREAAARAEMKRVEDVREVLGVLRNVLAHYEREIGLTKVKLKTEELRAIAMALWRAQSAAEPDWKWYDTDWVRYFWIGVGAVVMTGFLFLRQRIFWWPHPIGYVCYTNVHAMMKLWFSIFLGWLLKLCIIKYGGFRIYYKMRDFFIGLIVGEMTCGGFWILLKFILGVQGGWKIDIN